MQIRCLEKNDVKKNDHKSDSQTKSALLLNIICKTDFSMGIEHKKIENNFIKMIKNKITKCRGLFVYRTLPKRLQS